MWRSWGLQSKLVVAKWLLVLAATIAPPGAMIHSARDAAVMHGLEARLQAAKDVAEPGDLVWVAGAVSASPLALPPELAKLPDSLRIVESIEQYRRSGKSKKWRPVTAHEWIADDAMIGGWRLLPELIRDDAFPGRLASPCTEYQPDTAAWTVDCPAAEHAYAIGDDNRRLSYKVTPIPAGRISLLAEVAPGGEALTRIRGTAGLEPFAMLAQGERSAGEMIQDRLWTDWAIMMCWWAATTLVAGLWMASALRRGRQLTEGALFLASSRRAIVATTPLLGLFAIAKTSFFVPGAIGAGAAALALGFCLWFLAGDSR